MEIIKKFLEMELSVFFKEKTCVWMNDSHEDQTKEIIDKTIQSICAKNNIFNNENCIN